MSRLVVLWLGAIFVCGFVDILQGQAENVQLRPSLIDIPDDPQLIATSNEDNSETNDTLDSKLNGSAPSSTQDSTVSRPSPDTSSNTDPADFMSLDGEETASRRDSDVAIGLIAAIVAGVAVLMVVVIITTVAFVWLCRQRRETSLRRETAHIQSHFSTNLTHPEKAGLHASNMGLTMVLTESQLLSVLEPVGDRLEKSSNNLEFTPRHLTSQSNIGIDPSQNLTDSNLFYPN